MTTIRQKIAQFAAYQRTVRELNALTGRQLQDLGITREDIKTVARGNAAANGARAAFNSRDDGWVEKVRGATGGRGVDVVYDGVGKATFELSLDCLRPRGLMVSYGNASGPVTGVSLGILATKGSLYVTRPTTAHYFGTKDTLRRTMARVFGAVLAGQIRPAINQRFPLERAADAHRALEARETTGATLLIP